MQAVLKHAQEKSLLKNRTVTPDMLSDCDISPAGLKSTCDSFDGAQTQVLAAKRKYVIVKASWPENNKYWLVSDYYPVSSFDSTAVWSVDLTKRLVDDMIAHPEKIQSFYSDMRVKYPQGQ